MLLNYFCDLSSPDIQEKASKVHCCLLIETGFICHTTECVKHIGFVDLRDYCFVSWAYYDRKLTKVLDWSSLAR